MTTAVVLWMTAAVLGLSTAWAEPEAAPADEAPVEQVEVEEAAADEAAADEAPMEADADEELVEEEWVEEPAPSPWTTGLISSMVALSIGGLAAVLGIWVDRDTSRPVAFAGAMSVLIVSAVSVSMLQSYLDALDAIQSRADLDRMLDMVEEISAESDDPALAALVEQNKKRRRGARAAQ